jgi:hypothetical protein
MRFRSSVGSSSAHGLQLVVLPSLCVDHVSPALQLQQLYAYSTNINGGRLIVQGERELLFGMQGNVACVQLSVTAAGAGACA